MLVRNPSTYFNPSQSRLLSIRDSYSFESQLRKMYQLQTRAFVHFDSYVKKGYNVYFFTLTYDNDSLAWFTYKDSYSGNSYSCRCVDRNVVIKFFRDIRKYCDRYFNVHDIPYLFADERGGKRQRPHHHLLIAFPSSIDLNDVYRIVSYNWSYDLRDDLGSIVRDSEGHPQRRRYGWILPSQPSGDNYHRGILVNPSNCSYACRYASKYVLKNLEDNKDMSVNFVRSSILSNKDYESYRLFKRSMCKIKTSLGFGSDIERVCLESDSPYDSVLYGVNIPSISTDCKVVPSDYSVRRLTRRLVLDRVELDWKYKRSTS